MSKGASSTASQSVHISTSPNNSPRSSFTSSSGKSIKSQRSIPLSALSETLDIDDITHAHTSDVPQVHHTRSIPLPQLDKSRSDRQQLPEQSEQVEDDDENDEHTLQNRLEDIESTTDTLEHPRSRFGPEFPRLTEDDLEDLNLSTNKCVRLLYVTVGLISLALGIIGIFLPILPTAPFILLSAYLFAHSDARLYLWLLNHRIFGPSLRSYRKHRVIPLPAKIMATILIIVTLSTTIIFFIPIFAVKILLAVIGCSVLIYIWRHPSVVPEDEDITIEDVIEDIEGPDDIESSGDSKGPAIVDLFNVPGENGTSSAAASEIPT